MRFRALGLPAAAVLGACAGASTERSADGSRPGWAVPAGFASTSTAVDGETIHAVIGGEGPPVVFLHGNPTSSYVWRHVLPVITRAGWKAYAPDLIGMGASSKPEIPYGFDDHRRFLDGYLRHVVRHHPGRRLVLVGHDWGAALALDYAARRPETVAGVALLEGVMPPVFPIDDLATAPVPASVAEFFTALRTEGTGEQMILGENAFVERVLPLGTVRILPDSVMAVYRWPYREPRDRRPTLAWPRELPIEGQPSDVYPAFRRMSGALADDRLPKLVLYGDPGLFMPPDLARHLASTHPAIESVGVGRGIHYLQEDQPEAIGRELIRWMSRFENGSGSLSR